MAICRDEAERMQFADKNLAERPKAYENDTVQRLWSTPPATFPAILLCFSTVDLLGALYGAKGG